MDPFTFISLAERFSLLAISCTTQLNGMLAPLSLVLNNAGDPGMQVVYTALLQRKVPPHNRRMLHAALNELAEYICYLICEPKVMEGWISAFRYHVDLIPTMTSRAFLLLVTIACNFKDDLQRGNQTQQAKLSTVSAQAALMKVRNQSQKPAHVPPQPAQQRGRRNVPQQHPGWIPAVASHWPLSLQALVGYPPTSLSTQHLHGPTVNCALVGMGDSLIMLTRQNCAASIASAADAHIRSVIVDQTLDLQGRRCFSLGELSDQPKNKNSPSPALSGVPSTRFAAVELAMTPVLKVTASQGGSASTAPALEGELEETFESMNMVGLEVAESDLTESAVEESSTVVVDDKAQANYKMAGLPAERVQEAAQPMHPLVAAGLMQWLQWVRRKMSDRAGVLQLLQHAASSALWAWKRPYKYAGKFLAELCPLQVPKSKIIL